MVQKNRVNSWKNHFNDNYKFIQTLFCQASCDIAFTTARIRRMGKVMYSLGYVRPHSLGRPQLRFFPRSLVPGPFQGVPQSQVFSQVSGRKCLWGIPQSWGDPVLAGSQGCGTLRPGQIKYSPRTEQQSEHLLRLLRSCRRTFLFS